ncbi:MAG: cbb3-type cytochrome c oxidase subunit I [Flavobacteriales bacterium]|nr:cbb3-type cytochrome c oxidase subunit I [Flavobacteriales bacterium]
MAAEPLRIAGRGTASWFLIAGLLALWTGALFGVIGSWQHVVPGVVDAIPFVKSRPLHVSLVVAWIFLGALGGVYHHLPAIAGVPLHAPRLVRVHLGIFIGTGPLVVASYLMGRFGGREYWEFPPVLGIPIALGWSLFMYNFFRTVAKRKGPWPAYLWMWATGVVFFLVTYAEANLYLFPHFSSNMVRELTVQWKAYGALTGSWNMLVYGTSMVVMERITGDTAPARSRTAFLLYALGFTNLLFGWAHHIYPVPSAPWLRLVAYAISMTEWIILARIIRQWRGTLGEGLRQRHSLAHRFLFAGEVWVFLNLGLALLISIPAVNLFTHGTHITVAHAMGSTIGINTTILFASVFLIADAAYDRTVRLGFWLLNGALVLFWLCLIAAGLVKGWLTVTTDLPFQAIMDRARPFIAGFAVAGAGLFAGLSLLVWRAAQGLLVGGMQRIARDAGTFAPGSTTPSSGPPHR